MRRDKTPLLLMEQLAMLLVFALAAAVCLQLFVFSSQTSRRLQERDRAARLAQNTAETLQATGDVETALTQVSGLAPFYRDGFGHFLSYDEDWQALAYEGRSLDPRYTLQVLPLDSDLPGLGRAQVEVYVWKNGEMESLFSLETAWQEVSEHGA